MAEFLRKEPCPRCREQGNDKSGDNLAIYSDGSYHCFSECGYTKPSDEWLAENGKARFVEQEYDEMGQEFNNAVHDGIKSSTSLNSEWYRGIDPKISQWFGVRYAFDQDGNVRQVFYPTTKKSELVGYKTRIHPKTFTQPYGEVGKECDFFGQHRFRTFNGICVIVGGEHDQLAAFQMLKSMQKDGKYDPVAVVSSTIGETSSFKQAQTNYEFLCQFKKIIVCMDNDEAGKKSTERLVDVLPKGKVFVMNMRRKDPNAYLWEKETGRLVDNTREFVSDFWAAKPYVPDGVKAASDCFDEIEDELLKPRITLPPYMHEMQDMMGGGMIQGRIMNVIADTSVGKSTHVNRMVYHWIFNSPVKPTIVSLEATAAQYMIELISVHLEENILWNRTGLEIIDWLQTEEGIRVKHELCYDENGEPRFYIIDDRGGSIKDLEVDMERLFRKHDSKLFVIDVLTDMLRGSSEEHAEDHMKFQRNMVKNGVTIVNVMHTRKPTAGPDGKQRKVTEYDTLGTGSFVQSAAYNMVLNRDKLSENPLDRNRTEVDLPKCRGGKTGVVGGGWYYEFAKSKCHDYNDYVRDHPEVLEPVVNF